MVASRQRVWEVVAGVAQYCAHDVFRRVLRKGMPC